MTREVLTLYELNKLVRDVVETRFDAPYWVVGELSEAGSPAFGGHFYGELVQKDDSSDRIVARARLTCWARVFSLLRLRFQREAGEALRAGLQVKLLVKVTFHEQYGYALNIIDIDATFTLGDLARRRREILLQLERDGILHDNQTLPLPRLFRRIAVVSSPTAAGYSDFCRQLEDNDYGFRFDVRLFPAVMQGERVPQSIMAALEEVLHVPAEHTFDLVVIIRGGGASSDLSDFDNYGLAACIAGYPIPVVTGIGHERDETVLDHVAHTRVKTPTAAAAFIVEHQAQEAALLDELYLRLTRSASDRLQRERQRLGRQADVLPLLFASVIQRQQSRHAMIRQQLASEGRRLLERQKHELLLMQQRLDALDPERLLRRGFSITTCEGRVVRSIEGLEEGSLLKTRTEHGEIFSLVTMKGKGSEAKRKTTTSPQGKRNQKAKQAK